MDCLEACGWAAAGIVCPYPFAAKHVGDACDKYSNGHKAKGAVKAVCILTGAVVGGGLTIGLSPKMYEAFYKANADTDEKTSVFSRQTDTGLKVGAGLCVTLVDIWGVSFGAMVGGYVGDCMGASAECIVDAVGSCCNKVHNCFVGMKKWCTWGPQAAPANADRDSKLDKPAEAV